FRRVLFRSVDLIAHLATRAPQWRPLREQHQLPHDVGRALGGAVDGLETVQDRLVILRLQEQVYLAQDDHQGIVDLVRDAARQLPHRGQPLRANHVGVRATQLLELQPGFRVEPRVVEGQSDLVGGGFEQRDLLAGESLLGLPAEREGAQDPVAGADRYAQEAADAVRGDRGAGGGQEIRGAAGLVHAPHPSRGGHATDEALADRQYLVDLAQARREAALAAQ